MLIDILVAITGVLIFLFIFWKRLKEDYSSEIIFKLASAILIGILIFALISFRFYKPGFLWLEFAGALAGLTFAVTQFHVRFYETFESFIVSALPWLSFLFLKDAVTTSSLISFAAFLAILLFIFIFYYLDIHYKNFTWYKSGKIGFSGLVTLVLIFVTRSALAISRIPVISFLGRYEVYASGILAAVSVVLLFNLGRQKK